MQTLLIALRGAIRVFLPACLLFAMQASAKDFDYAELHNLILRNDVKSVEEVLPLLPESLRAQYVLVFHSRSLQGSSETYPRVILFDQHGGFAVSFNGDPSQKGFDALETMQFDFLRKSFQYREIRFSHERNADNGQSNAIQFSEENPKKCQACHGSPAAPVWDAFPNWPGAYSEHYNTRLSETERAGLRGFLDIQPTHSRYKSLLGVARFEMDSTFKPDGKSQYSSTPIEPPNAQFGEMLARLNIQRLARATATAPEFDSFGFVLLGALSPQCGSLDEFFPSDLRQEVLRNYLDFEAHATRASRRNAVLKNIRNVSPGNPVHADDAQSLAAYRFVSSMASPNYTGRWSPALERDNFDFSGIESAPMTLAGYLRSAIARSDERLHDLIAVQDDNHDGKYCRYLRQKSVAQLDRLIVSDARWRARITLAGGMATDIANAGVADEAIPARPPELESCANCHTGTIGPALPFAEPELLARMLIDKQYPRGSLLDEILYRLSADAGAQRMPLNAELSDSQRLELTRYFKVLASQAK